MENHCKGMNLIDFIKKYSGKKVDFDGAFGAQCVDLFRQYSKEVNGTPHTGAVDGAKDLFLSYDKLPQEKKYYFRIKESAGTIFQSGDVAVWGATASNKYGHVAIIVSDLGSGFIVFEQDGYKQDGAKLSYRERGNMLGVLRAYKTV